MAFSTMRFGQDSAFERYVLDEIAPALLITPGLQIVDYRDENRSSPRIHAVVAGAPVRAVAHVNGQPTDINITPMIFGAAWKVLDLVLDGIFSPTPMSIEGKCRNALTGNGPQRLPPFKSEVEAWRRIMRLYANTLDLRHSVVHRELIVHPDGRLEASSDPTKPRTSPTIITRDELGYFCRVVQGFAEALINGSLTARERANLLFLLDQLQTHHGLGALPGREITRLVLVMAKPQMTEDGLSFDARPVLKLVREKWPTAGIDLLLRLPDGTVLGGELEQAPTDRATVIHAQRPPKWMEALPATEWSQWDRLGAG
ncbi:hypothetical protein [Streptosporangium jomthongense]|uniref:Uncharacterized protein n=1 Tax=Streptosporangium jomthongense TaxID=1193683 RepID=A0ABV8FEQ4_9ACTN